MGNIFDDTPLDVSLEREMKNRSKGMSAPGFCVSLMSFLMPNQKDPPVTLVLPWDPSWPLFPLLKLRALKFLMSLEFLSCLL